jgi:hypothetical protein
MQNGKQTWPNVGNTMQNRRQTLPNVANTMQNDILVPNCCIYKADGTRKEEQTKIKNYSTTHVECKVHTIRNGTIFVTDCYGNTNNV